MVTNNRDVIIKGFISMKYDIRYTEWAGIWRIYGYLEKEEFNKIYNELKRKYNSNEGFRIETFYCEETISYTIYIFVKDKGIIKLQYLPEKVKIEDFDIKIFGYKSPVISKKIIDRLEEVFNSKEDADIFLTSLVYSKLVGYVREIGEKKILESLKNSRVIKKVVFE